MDANQKAVAANFENELENELTSLTAVLHHSIRSFIASYHSILRSFIVSLEAGNSLLLGGLGVVSILQTTLVAHELSARLKKEFNTPQYTYLTAPVLAWRLRSRHFVTTNQIWYGKNFGISSAMNTHERTHLHTHWHKCHFCASNHSAWDDRRVCKWL